MKHRGFLSQIPLATFVLGCLSSAAMAVEPEKQPIYTNVPGGLMCGNDSAHPCTVPPGKRLVIEYVSGYAFRALSPKETIAVSLAIKSPQLGLNGGSFHHFVAHKTNTTEQRDVFAFSTPFRMMLGPQSTFYFSEAAAVGVSGYLVNSP